MVAAHSDGMMRVDRLRRSRATALLFLLGTVGCVDGPFAPTATEPLDLAAPWEAVAPREVGLDWAALTSADVMAEAIPRMRSLVVVRHGRLAFERYYHGASRDETADVRSVTKSVVAALVGIAIDEGAIEGVDQPITDFVTSPDFDVRAEHEAVTIGDLLTMGSGIEWSESGAVGYGDWVTSDDPIAYLLGRDFSDPPGSDFSYNSAAVHLLGVIVELATGRSLPDYAAEVLFGPLGIHDVVWEPLRGGYVNGGAGVDLRPRDLARFGQLLVQGGRSGTRQIVPSEWIDRSFSATWPALGSVARVGQVGYGYLWWIDTRRTAAFAWGYGGQFIYADPDLDLIVVATTNWFNLSRDIGSAGLSEQVLGVIVDGVLRSAR